MKKTLIISALLLSLGTAVPVAAQDSVRAEFEAKRAELQNKIKQNQDRIKEARAKIMGEATTTKEMRKEGRKEMKDFRHDLARKHVGNAARIFGATIERLETLIERIESRIEKVKASGVDTTAAEDFVKSAELNIADAKSHMSIIASTDVSTSTNSTTTARANFELVKKEAKSVRESLILAKQNLMKAVQALKGLGDNVRMNATTTNTNE